MTIYLFGKSRCVCVHAISQTLRYKDPDAERREDWDGPPVVLRAQRRFQKRLMNGGEAAMCGDVPPAIEEEFGGAAVPDLTETLVEGGHVPLREALVRNFEILWKKKEVQWLKYPDRKKQKAAVI